jgi:hypothetical protein
MKAFIYGFVFATVVAVAAAVGYVASGSATIAASVSEPTWLQWLMHTTYHRSLAQRAQNIAVPSGLDNEDTVLAGARSFEQMCSGCHTPPGLEATTVSQGMNPPPPDLTELMGEHGMAQIFWVASHGVRMTGMPAFGPTHDDEQLWQLAAFVRRAKHLDSDGYRELVERARQAGGADGHDHRHVNEGGNEPAVRSGSAPAKTPGGEGPQVEGDGFPKAGAGGGESATDTAGGLDSHQHHGDHEH